MKIVQRIFSKNKVIMILTEQSDLLSLMAYWHDSVKPGDIVAIHDEILSVFRPVENNLLIHISGSFYNQTRNFILDGNYIIETPKKEVVLDAIEIQSKEQLALAKYINKNAKIGSFIIKGKFEPDHISFEEFMEKFSALPNRLKRKKGIPPTV